MEISHVRRNRKPSNIFHTVKMLYHNKNYVIKRLSPRPFFVKLKMFTDSLYWYLHREFSSWCLNLVAAIFRPNSFLLLPVCISKLNILVVANFFSISATRKKSIEVILGIRVFRVFDNWYGSQIIKMALLWHFHDSLSDTGSRFWIPN